MKVPDFLKMEYMPWYGKATVIAGFVMLLAIVFILGLWEGYKLSVHSLANCQAMLDICKNQLLQLK